MPDFAVVLTDRAIADLNGRVLKARLQIAQDVASLARDPLPPRSTVKILKGYRPPLYRLRAGDYRVLYRVAQRTVTECKGDVTANTAIPCVRRRGQVVVDKVFPV